MSEFNFSIAIYLNINILVCVFSLNVAWEGEGGREFKIVCLGQPYLTTCTLVGY